jgi:hypothetical protein
MVWNKYVAIFRIFDTIVKLGSTKKNIFEARKKGTEKIGIKIQNYYKMKILGDIKLY